MKKLEKEKCTCENFQQNEDCEHIGNRILRDVGLLAEEMKEDNKGLEPLRR